MRVPAFCTATLAYLVIGQPPPAVAQVDQQRAQEYFKQAQALCELDGGRLGGIDLRADGDRRRADTAWVYEARPSFMCRARSLSTMSEKRL